jgi:hypothetical protein
MRTNRPYPLKRFYKNVQNVRMLRRPCGQYKGHTASVI